MSSLKHPYVPALNVWITSDYELHKNGTLTKGRVINGNWWLHHDGEGNWKASEYREPDSPAVTEGWTDPEKFRLIDKGYGYQSTRLRQTG